MSEQDLDRARQSIIRTAAVFQQALTTIGLYAVNKKLPELKKMVDDIEIDILNHMKAEGMRYYDEHTLAKEEEK